MSWLQRHRGVTLALALLHVLLSVFTHAGVQDLARWLSEQLTLERMSLGITYLCGTGLVVGSVCAARGLHRTVQRTEDRRVLGILALATVGATVLAYQTLLMINTEVIHFPQFALLGILVFVLRPRFGEAVLWVTLAGAIDEAYQYWVLNAEVPQYLDFNDIGLDMLGGSLGALAAGLLLAPDPGRAPYSAKRFFRSGAFLTFAAISLLAGVLSAVGFLTTLPRESASIVLRSIGERPEEFFQTSYWGRTVHVLSPLEGWALIVAWIGFLVFLDGRSSATTLDASTEARTC